MKGNRKVTFPTEGFLFPDTYFIPYDATADDVVAMMLKNFDAHLTDAMKAGIAKQNLSIYQLSPWPRSSKRKRNTKRTGPSSRRSSRTA